MAPSTSLMVTRGEGADEQQKCREGEEGGGGLVGSGISAGELLFHSPSVQVRADADILRNFVPSVSPAP